ncbi:MAG: hypothetical protein AAFS10_10485, partial [Myxococcota bacterium]
YLLARLVALADQEGFLVVRPRSLSSNGPSGTIYRWDENPGDLERNVAYTKTLLAHLAQQLHLDSERMYASGFSSGSNMVAQFLADPEDTFAGLGLMAGGIWADPGIGDLGGRQERFYAVTGFRDYLHFTWVRLSTLLDAQGMDPALRWERQVDAGHELHGWHFEEMWHWLDRGQRPQPEPQAPEWSPMPGPEGDVSGLELAQAPDGALILAGSAGSLWRQPAGSGTWLKAADVVADLAVVGVQLQDYRPALTGLCLLDDGRGVAVGEGAVVLTDDGGMTWGSAENLPALGEGAQLGTSYLNGVACKEPSTLVAAGYWSGAFSDTAGTTWSNSDLSYSPGAPAQLTALDASPWGTVMAVGYFYLGRSDEGQTFETLPLPTTVGWLNDVKAGPDGLWWAVGDGGVILHSADDGETWRAQRAFGSGDDLYAVDVWDADRALAVGARGAAVVTTNGGLTWRSVPTGQDGFLGDVLWLDATEAITVGQNGTMLRYTAP